MGKHIQSPLNKEARILIVDDSEISVSTMKRLLEREGYEHCTGFSDPRQAVEHFLAEPPHLLLLDWHMDPLSGEEFLEEVSMYVPEGDMPPVLILTADSAVDVRRRALQCGATDFLTKPVDYIEMFSRIRNLLRLRMLHLDAQSEAVRLETKVKERTRELEQSLAQLKETQKQVIQQERLRALGAMAGGVAHDFNNVLMVILGFGEFYVKADDATIREDPSKIREALSIMMRGAKDAVEMVRRLGEFYRPQRTVQDNVDVEINTVVREAAQLCEPKWQTQKRGEGIFIDLRMELGDVPIISAAPTEMREMIMNLIFNAVDALPEGGRILLRTGIEEDHVAIEVEDSGTGMTEETKAHCMEPFFTTKGDEGTGLGLAIIHGIVRRHHGSIRIATEPGEGTKFTILLPIGVHGDHVAGEAPALREERVLKVLVVDDNPEVCHVTVRFLEQDGHEVTTAENGLEALEKFRADQFDLIVTDCSMPKMNGDQMATAIKEMNPAVPIILLTGFSPQQHPVIKNVDLLLSKPVSLNSMRKAIHQVVVPVTA